MTTVLLLMMLAAEAPAAAPEPATEPTTAPAAESATEPTTEPAAEAAELPRLMVIDLKVEEGVSASAARLLNEMLLAKLQATGKYEVFGQADLRSMLDLEKEKQLTGCSDVACMSEIAGALGAERALFGSVGALGDMYVLNLHMVNNAESRVEARWSESFDGDEEELVGAVDRAVASLVPVAAATTVVEEEDRFYQTWWFWSLVGVGAVGATAGIITATRSDKNTNGPSIPTDVTVVLP